MVIAIVPSTEQTARAYAPRGGDVVHERSVHARTNDSCNQLTGSLRMCNSDTQGGLFAYKIPFLFTFSMSKRRLMYVICLSKVLHTSYPFTKFNRFSLKRYKTPCFVTMFYRKYYLGYDLFRNVS